MNAVLRNFILLVLFLGITASSSLGQNTINNYPSEEELKRRFKEAYEEKDKKKSTEKLAEIYKSMQVPVSEREEALKIVNEFYNEKNQEKKKALAEVFFKRWPYADDEVRCCDWVEGMRKYSKRLELKTAYDKREEAEKIYTQEPNQANLDNLMTAFDSFIEKFPDDAYHSIRLARYISDGVMVGFYPDIKRAAGYVSKARKIIEGQVPKEWNPQDWVNFQLENLEKIRFHDDHLKSRVAALEQLKIN